MALDGDKQEVGLLQVAQELHGVCLLLGLEHDLLGEQLVQLCVEDHFRGTLLGIERVVGLLLNDLLEHLAAERLEGEVGVVAQFEEIGLEEVAVEATAATAEVQNAALEGVAAGVEDGHSEGVKVHLLLVKEEQVEAVVGRVRLPHWQAKTVAGARHSI